MLATAMIATFLSIRLDFNCSGDSHAMTFESIASLHHYRHKILSLWI